MLCSKRISHPKKCTCLCLAICSFQLSKVYRGKEKDDKIVLHQKGVESKLFYQVVRCSSTLTATTDPNITFLFVPFSTMKYLTFFQKPERSNDSSYSQKKLFKTSTCTRQEIFKGHLIFSQVFSISKFWYLLNYFQDFLTALTAVEVLGDYDVAQVKLIAYNLLAKIKVQSPKFGLQLPKSLVTLTPGKIHVS